MVFPELLKEFRDSGYSLSDSIAFLRKVGLVSLETGKLGLLTRDCKVVPLPDGRVAAGDDADARFSGWLTRFMREFEANKK